MAFENLEPFKDEIIALRQPGPHRKTLQEVCESLFERNQLRTTPGTLSRYLKELQTTGSPVAAPEATPEQEQRLEMIGLKNLGYNMQRFVFLLRTGQRCTAPA